MEAAIALLEAMTINAPGKERRRMHALLWALEVRKVRVSALAAPLSRIFGMPLTDLLHRDPSACMLDDLRVRYCIDTQVVMARAASGLNER